MSSKTNTQLIIKPITRARNQHDADANSNASQISYQWFDNQSQMLQVSSADQLANLSTDSVAITLIAPAEQCTIMHYSFEASESKLLRQTLPYNLEDELLTDVDELHFALGDAANGKVPVAIIPSSLLSTWLTDLKNTSTSTALEVKLVLPEFTLLPWLENQWTLLLDDSQSESSNDERYLLRSSSYQGFAVTELLLAKTIELLVAEQGLPNSVVLYCRDEQRELIKSKLPESIQELVLWQSGDYWSLITSQPSTENASRSLNLLQAMFARSLPWRKSWLQWRGAITLLAAVAAINITFAYGQHYQLSNKNLALRSDIENVYRTAIPKGAVVDPEKQLRRKVDALQGVSDDGFTTIFNKVAMVTNRVNGFSIQNMNYSEKQNEIRLTVMAKSFKDVETVRSGLQKQGVQAELTGSSSEGGKTRARLRIRG